MFLITCDFLTMIFEFYNFITHITEYNSYRIDFVNSAVMILYI